jgi:hypothetical protein
MQARGWMRRCLARGAARGPDGAIYMFSPTSRARPTHFEGLASPTNGRSGLEVFQVNPTIACTFFGALILTACSSSTPGPATGNDAGGGKIPSPPELRQFESSAEAMSTCPLPDAAHMHAAWDGCQSTHDSAVMLWEGLKPTLKTAGVPADKITAIDGFLTIYNTDVGAKKTRDAETDANKITSAVPDVFDFFTYNAPTDTLRLDGTFRQMQIDAEYSDWAGAQKDLDDTKAIWTGRLKAVVAAQAPSRKDIMGSQTVVADVDATLVSAQMLIGHDGGTPSDSAQLVQVAQNGLDETDTCEQIFK